MTALVMTGSDWREKAEQYLFRNRLDRQNWDGPVLVRGSGSVVWDVDGREYLDFNSGQLCAALGHCPPRVVEAVSEAAKTMIHSSRRFFNVPEIALAEKLASMVPEPLQKSFFGLSGADATEGALNLAKNVTGRFEVAAPHINFAGLSDTPRSVSFAPPWHKGIPVPAPGNFAIMAPYCHRCPIGRTYPECGTACLSGSFQLLDAETTGSIAAVITEPLFSAGGVVEPPAGWLRLLSDACKERGALLIVDESQTGLGKLGTMWGFEHHGVVPDIICLSKHFGGGIAISAVITTQEIEERAVQNGFLSTHSHTGDPLACAAALASLEMVEEDGLVERANQLGEYWLNHMESLRSKYGCIGDIRGRGLLHAFEFENGDGTPATGFAYLVSRASMEAGLLLSVGRNGSVLRFSPPFTTTETQMDKAAEILDAALKLATSEYQHPATNAP